LLFFLDQDHLRIAGRMDKDLFFGGNESDPHKMSLPRNNRKQQQAIDKALTSRFTLIQGPPGRV